MSSDYIVGSRRPKPGDKVLIVEKKNYGSGQLTPGVVKDVLTSAAFHPRGHKVRLQNGTIGRVQAFGEETEPSKVQPAPAQANQPYTPSPDELV